MDAPALREIDTPKCRVQATIVEHLEELLGRARKGELESVVWFVEEATSRKQSWGCSGAMDQVQLIGRLEIVRHAIVASFTEGARDI